MITEEKLEQIVLTARARINEMFDEILREVTEGTSPPPTSPDHQSPVQRDDHSADSKWHLADTGMQGSWERTGVLEGQTYRWPDGNVDSYERLTTFSGSGDYEGMELGVGVLPNGETVGFVFGKNGKSKRGIVYFQRTDDFESSGELVSMIRGGGTSGRAGFAPGEQTPAAYGDFRIETLGDRKAGKWNVQAVVASRDDLEPMLNHTALQAQLRGL